MTSGASDDEVFPAALIAFLADRGFGQIVDSASLNGGMISLTRRLTTDSGDRFVVKQTSSGPDDLYALEAEGLHTLGAAGIPTPEVVAVSPDYLLLEDLGTASHDDLDWEAFGRAVASQHAHHTVRFGFDHDNYLGLLPHVNGWMDDGHEFFAQNRILNFLPLPLCEKAFSAEDRARLERYAAKLPDLIPVQPASLLHGDLWLANIVPLRGGGAALVDPAVYYGWAEADLAMAQQCGRIPDAFFAGYTDVNPLADGWKERLEVLYIREALSGVADLDDDHPYRGACVRSVLDLLDKFA